MLAFTVSFNKIFRLKGLKPKNKGHMNFYECCDFTKKVCLIYMLHIFFPHNCKVLLMDNLSQQFQRIKFQNKHFSKREDVVMYVYSVVEVSSG